MKRQTKRGKSLPNSPGPHNKVQPNGLQFWEQFAPAGIPRLLARMQAAVGAPCFLCGSSATTPACFQPSAPEAWGGRPGKLRVFVYGLCNGCYQLPAAERMLRVEGKLAAGVVGPRN
jgi:hypothetical protein